MVVQTVIFIRNLNYCLTVLPLICNAMHIWRYYNEDSRPMIKALINKEKYRSFWLRRFKKYPPPPTPPTPPPPNPPPPQPPPPQPPPTPPPPPPPTHTHTHTHTHTPIKLQIAFPNRYFDMCNNSTGISDQCFQVRAFCGGIVRITNTFMELRVVIYSC